MVEVAVDGEGRASKDGRGGEDRVRDNGVARHFSTGATRDTAEGKIQPKGALSPLVLRRFCEYMRAKQILPDGTIRSASNWKLGIDRESYADSFFRHQLELHLVSEGWLDQDIEETLCAVIFNAQGWLHELLRRKTESSIVE